MKKNKTNKKNIITKIFKGDILSSKENQRYFPYILFVVLLIIINITLYFHAEQLVREIHKKEKDLYELRVEYITTKSELMDKYKRSTIENNVISIGLRSSLFAPKIIEK